MKLVVTQFCLQHRQSAAIVVVQASCGRGEDGGKLAERGDWGRGCCESHFDGQSSEYWVRECVRCGRLLG